ncbi:MAG: TolC family protein, partial [Calditrichaeota bacterium]|nr:TolC family protein [Calditrichota bacterium]
MKSFFNYVFILFFFSCSLLSAQTVVTNLSLEQALRIAENNNFSLQQQQQRIRQAATELDIQKASLYPRLLINGSTNYTSQVAEFTAPFLPVAIEAGTKDVYDANLTIQQPLFTGFRTLNLIQSAEESLKENEVQRQTALNEIFLQIHNIYYAVQLNMLQQEVLRSSIRRATNDLKTVRNFFQAGQASAFDTLKVTNAVLSHQTELNKLTHEQQIFLTQMAYVLNVEKIHGIEPFSQKNPKIMIDSMNIYQSAALNNRPELSQMRHRIQAQIFRKKSAQSLHFPQIFAQASYHYGKPGVNFFQKEWMDYYRVGITLQWELWNRSRISNQVKQAEFAIQMMTLDEKKLLDKINQQVEEAYENLRSDIDQIDFLKRLVDQEKERYRIVREK